MAAGESSGSGFSAETAGEKFLILDFTSIRFQQNGDEETVGKREIRYTPHDLLSDNEERGRQIIRNVLRIKEDILEQWILERARCNLHTRIYVYLVHDCKVRRGFILYTRSQWDNGGIRIMVAKLRQLQGVDASDVCSERQSSCTICLEEFSDNGDETSVCVLPCSHVYHRYCIERWLLRSDSCPLCRHRLLTII